MRLLPTLASTELMRIGKGVFGKLVLIALVLIPSIYGGLLVWSNLDVTTNLDRVPAAIVNLDKAATVTDANGKKQTVPLGRVVSGRLLSHDNGSNLDWKLTDASDATAGLADGTYYAVLTIPEGFSSAATSTADADKARKANLELDTNDATSYLAGNIASTIGSKLSQATGDQLSQQYLDRIYLGFNGIQENFAKAAKGAADLRNGTTQLGTGLSSASDGATQLNGGLGSLATGATSLSSGVGQLATGADALAGGANRLSSGAGQLATGLDQAAAATAALPAQVQQLANGAKALSTGVGQLAQGAAPLAKGAGDVAQGGQALADGATKLADGAQGLTTGTKSLSDNAATLSQGAGALSSSVGDYAGAVSSLSDSCADSGASEAFCARLAQTSAAGERLQAGAERAAAGTSELAAGADRLATGAASLGSGASPLRAGADKLSAGATALQQGATKFGTGVTELQGGAGKLAGGLNQFVAKVPEFGAGVQRAATAADQIAAGATSLSTGAQKLSTGASLASAGATKLASGAQQAHSASGQLASGLGKLSAGADKVDDGAAELAKGLKEGAAKVPTYDPTQRDRLATVVAQPVGADDTRLHAVPSYGYGLAPYFMALGLWVGGMSLFFMMRPLSPRAIASTAPAWRVALSGLMPAAVVGVAQAVVLWAIMTWWVGLDMARPGLFLAFALLTSLTFIAINHALVAALGPAGRFIGLIIVVLQLSSAGATYPIEASPGFFQTLHGLLPLTYAVRAFRTLIAGGALHLGPAAAVLVAWLLVAMLVAIITVRRRRTWSMTRLRPERAA